MTETYTLAGIAGGFDSFLIIKASEAKKIALEYNASQEIIKAVKQVNEYNSSSNPTAEKVAGAVSGLRGVLDSLSNNSKISESLSTIAETQLNSAILSLYGPQLQAIRNTAKLGKFELIFDLTEQAKSDLTPYLKEQGYNLTSIPISSIEKPSISVNSLGAGAIKSTINKTATYNGRSITYVVYGTGSNMILVSW